MTRTRLTDPIAHDDVDKAAEETMRLRRLIRRLGKVIKDKAQKINNTRQRYRQARGFALEFESLAKKWSAYAAQYEMELSIHGGLHGCENRINGSAAPILGGLDLGSAGWNHQGAGGISHQEDGGGDQRVDVRRGQSEQTSEGFGANGSSIRQAANKRGEVEQSLLRIKDVMRRYSISHSAIYILMNRGEFPARVKIGKASYWRVKDLEDWVQNLKEHCASLNPMTPEAKAKLLGYERPK